MMVKKITTESGRVYLVDMAQQMFTRVGDGVAPGQWYPNNTPTRFTDVEGMEVGKQAFIWQRGSYADPDLYQRTSPIISIVDISA